MAGFSKKNILNIKLMFLFCVKLLSETFLILRRIELDMIKMFHGDGRTDMTKIIVSFCNFAHAPKYRNVSVFRYLDTLKFGCSLTRP
jgi:hypothetical protein